MTKTTAWLVFACSVAVGCGGGGTSAPALSKLTISVSGNIAAPFSMAVGSKVKLAASVVGSNGQVVAAPFVTWQSSGSSATVDTSGLVRGVSVGTVYIKAMSTTNGAVVADSVSVSVAGT